MHHIDNVSLSWVTLPSDMPNGIDFCFLDSWGHCVPSELRGWWTLESWPLPCPMNLYLACAFFILYLVTKLPQHHHHHLLFLNLGQQCHKVQTLKLIEFPSAHFVEILTLQSDNFYNKCQFFLIHFPIVSHCRRYFVQNWCDTPHIQDLHSF